MREQMPGDLFPTRFWVLPARRDPARLQLILLSASCRDPFVPIGPVRTREEMTAHLMRCGLVDVDAVLKASVRH